MVVIGCEVTRMCDTWIVLCEIWKVNVVLRKVGSFVNDERVNVKLEMGRTCVCVCSLTQL